MPNRIDIAPGTRFKMLTVINELEPRIRTNGKPRRILLCRCDCGAEKHILFQSFTVGRVASCGCHQRKVVANGAHAKKHGLSSHPIFSVWRAMLNRCYDEKHKGYKHYGARGIHVCSEWLESPGTFHRMVYIEWVEARATGRQDRQRQGISSFKLSNSHQT